MANYIDVEEAQDYADEQLNVDAWEDAKDEDGSLWGEPGTKCYKALTMATKAINRLNYAGDKTDEDQVNAFPRGEDTEVPDDIKRATFEIALALLDGIDLAIEMENQTLVSQGYANIRSTHDRSSPAPYIIAGIPSAQAWLLLLPYLRDNRSVTILRAN